MNPESRPTHTAFSPEGRSPELLEQLRTALRARHRSYATEKAYVRWVRRRWSTAARWCIISSQAWLTPKWVPAISIWGNMRRCGSVTICRKALEYSVLGVLRLDESIALTGCSHPGLGLGARRLPHRRAPSERRPRVAVKSPFSRHLNEDSPLGTQVTLRSTHRRTPTTGSSAACTPQNSDSGAGRVAAK